MKELAVFIREKHYKAETFLLVTLLSCLGKIILFSLTVETPEMGWEWEVKTLPVLLLANAALLFVLLSPLPFMISKKRQVIYGTAVNGSISLFIIANRIYYLFFHSYISPQTVFHSQEALSMWQAIFSTVRIWELMWLVDIILIGLVFLNMQETIQEKERRAPFVKFARYFFGGLFVFAFSLNLYGDVHFQENINLRKNGLLAHYLRESVGYAYTQQETVPFQEDIEAIDEWFEDRREEEEEIEGEDESFAMLQGKNLIVLQVEALQEVVINKRVNGQEITPNLNRILEESLYFSRCYDQVDMATADAEVLVNLSQHPLTDVSVYMRYPENVFNSLANTLREAGYRDTAAFHGFKREFYNREEVYPNMGFTEYFSRRHYEKDEVYNNLLGDRTFLDQTAGMLEDLDEPYYAFIITLTSHHPFNYLEDYDGIDVGDYEGTIVGDYIKSIHYTDAAVGEFYNRLQLEGKLDDTLLVIYGDHVAFNYNEIHMDALNTFFGDDMQDPINRMEHHRVPLFFRFPGKERVGVINDVAGMIDIYPTVINLLGIKNDYLMGRDLLNTRDNMAILKHGSFVKGDILYYNPTRTMVDLETGEQQQYKETNELALEVERTLNISNKIYDTDYFRTLEER